MAIKKGYLSSLGIGVELTFGAGIPAGGAGAIPIISHSLKRNVNLTTSNVIRGSRNPAGPVTGFVDVSGDIVVPVGYTSFGALLNLIGGALGTLSFAALDAQPSLAIVDGGAMTYKGCKVSKLSFKFGGDGEITATLSIIGKDGAAGGVVTGAAGAIDPVLWKHLTLSLGGASTTQIEEISVDVDFGLDGSVYTIGENGTRREIPEGLA